ncbi:response regulator [Cohnella sp. WQ 127256]|uniref:response regulator n=1 Tax=Cohnella sp. WQ 127256 TaxID=2938790 RepID=UPI0021173725|nr:response regulator [Cohnella sp. WQ 127256]
MKIMIVDDEVIIRTGLCTVIDWKELGLELLPPASSAEEALERIPLEKPHILLTDIRMSGMDGIQLAKEVKEMLPDTEILILTGYDDFSYAQQAIRGGVMDYLLKTSRPEEIIKAAMKAKQNITKKQELLKQENLQTSTYSKQLLIELLNKGLDKEDVSSLDKIRDWFRKYDVEQNKGELIPMQVILISASGWGEKPFDVLLQGAVDNIFSELLPCITLLSKDQLLLVVRYEEGLTDRMSLLQVLQRVEKTLKCTVFCTLGCTVTNYESLKASYQEAQEIYAFKGLIGARGLFTIGDIEDRTGSRTVCSEKEEAELAAILMSNDATELRHWVNQTVRAQLEDPAALPTTLRGFLQSMVISGHRWSERTYSSQDGGMQGVPMPATLSFELEGRPEDEVFKQLSYVMSAFHQAMDQSRFSYIPKSIAYIKENLDQSLSLHQVASFVHLNQNHFCEVFKRETGLTYLEFVTQERMRKATEMLRSTPNKVSEVAKRVGYLDIKYFTQQFKKHTGKTPSEYRQVMKDTE